VLQKSTDKEAYIRECYAILHYIWLPWKFVEAPAAFNYV